MTTTASREAFEKFFADSRRSRGPSKRPTFERLPDDTYADDHTQRHWWTWQQALAAQPAPAAVVYPPDGTVSPFTVINLGAGRVQMGDSIHDGRLPALWFGTNGQGMGHEEVMNRQAHEGETLAVVTFANVEGLDVLLDVIQRIRRVSFPGAAS
jgi:hypothetical protein